MTDPPLDRREFSRRLALSATIAPAAALGCGTPAAAPVDKPPAAGPGADKPPVDKPPAAAPAPPREAEAEAKKPPSPAIEQTMALILSEFPHDYAPADLEEVRRQVARQLARSLVLRSYPLTNADEPAAVYTVFRAPDPRP